ncbi:MAG: aminopeptidase P family protein [Campylobacteraceae bacterium]|nr:aminopeptidase P family protein [Campylobacteraceae bacterium]
MNTYILQNENALFYECNFSCDNAIFVRFNKKDAFFITDSRYTTEAKEFVKNAEVVNGEKNLTQKLIELIKKFNPKNITFDPKEWSVEKFECLKKELRVNFISSPNFSQIKREIKRKDEIDILKKAANEGRLAFDRFCEFVKKDGIGLSEEELFFHAELIFKDRGKLRLSFSPIVAINENSAKPHATPTKKSLKNGDLLLVDAGITYSRYCSDRTRVCEVNSNMSFSKEQYFSCKKRQKIYDTVLLANKEAIKIVKPGIKASEVDKVAREVIKEAGYGEFFIHSTGHGVGLDIHELPIVSQNSEAILKEGMIFTIEPGIYLPNEFGVRVEDMVLVTKDSVEVL